MSVRRLPNGRLFDRVLACLVVLTLAVPPLVSAQTPPPPAPFKAEGLDQLAAGRMIGGFALVAFPAQYGVSGIMTFIVNHEGVVYQKDLGPNTATIARGIKLFNPDGSWKKA